MSRARIAIVDDDATQLELLSGLLEDEGYEVVGETDLHAGFGFIQWQRPTLVLMDIVQNRQPLGLELIRALKADPDLRSVQIVVLSADAPMLRRHAEQFARDGIVAMGKPYDIEDVLELVRDRVRVAGHVWEDHPAHPV